MQKENIFFWKNLSIRTKLLLTFCLTASIMFVVNMILYNEINHSMQELDTVYSTNVRLNELSECLEQIQNEVYEYLNTKSSDSLEKFYRNEQNLSDMLEQLNGSNVDNAMKMLEKNIRNMADSYLSLAEETVQAKRGRNIERYKESYTETNKYYHYIQTAIYNLNNLQFRLNTDNYQTLLRSLSYAEVMSSGILITVAIVNLILLSLMVRSIIQPLHELAVAANEVAEGKFDVSLPNPDAMDEVGIVTVAFSKMVTSIREYLEQLRDSMEMEQRLKERELLMETHLKDAQLKYLQAQINPHFLFNSLNAGVQLSMLEDAEQTSIFLENMADFLRYNVRKVEEATTLAEEIEAVDSYVYILNVRFAGDIHFEKDIEAGVGEIQLPSMIIQPLVENAVNHGIRDVDWEGHIWLSVKKERNYLVISVKDNGQGMTRERIEEILECHVSGNRLETDSTGIGLDNVIHRLELYFNQKDLVQIYSEGIGKGCEVRMNIPFDNNQNQ